MPARERPSVAAHRRWRISESLAAVVIPLGAAIIFIAGCWVLERPLAIWSVAVALLAGAAVTLDWSTGIWRERQRHCSEADNWLSTSAGRGVPSRYAARAEELCSERERRALAKALRNHTAAAQSTRLYGSVVLDNRRGIRQTSDLIESIAARLNELDRPVTPAGVLLLRQLLTNATSPIYWRRRNPDLERALVSVANVLEPHVGTASPKTETRSSALS